MPFLKGLFWFLLAVLVAVFLLGNWTSVTIKLWGGLVADVNLPLLLLVAFLFGLVPIWAYHHAVRWRLRQRLAALERALNDLTAPPPPASPVIVPAPLLPPVDVPPEPA